MGTFPLVANVSGDAQHELQDLGGNAPLVASGVAPSAFYSQWEIGAKERMEGQRERGRTLTRPNINSVAQLLANPVTGCGGN